MRSYAIIILTALSVFLFGQNLVLKGKLKATEANLASIEMELNDHTCDKATLSEWDMFTLALMKVESNYEPTAVSSVGAKGYFQITPIYVEEVNRVHTTNYIYDEVVKSFDLSYEAFTLMQEAHNEEYNMDEALRLHNGDHKWYRKRVYKEMNAIEKYEEMRRMVKEANSLIQS
jgi:hypothetical protein